MVMVEVSGWGIKLSTYPLEILNFFKYIEKLLKILIFGGLNAAFFCSYLGQFKIFFKNKFKSQGIYLLPDSFRDNLSCLFISLDRDIIWSVRSQGGILPNNQN